MPAVTQTSTVAWRSLAVGLGLLLFLPAWLLASAEFEELPTQGAFYELGLSGGAQMGFSFLGDASAHLLFIVEQQGIDVTLDLLGPDDEPLLRVDTPNGRWGPEMLVFEPRSGVPYLFYVRSADADAPSGRIRFAVEYLHGDPEGDPSRLAAVQAVTEGGRHFVEGTSASRRQAVDSYMEALRLWQLLEERQEAADTLFHLAMLHRFLKEPQEALALHRRTLGLRQELGDRRGEARSWLEVGSAAWAMGESRYAPDAYGRALEIWRQLGDLHSQARALNYLGLVWARKAPRKALPFYGEALDLFRQTGDVRQEITVLNNLGGIQDLLGEPHRALAHYQASLDLSRERGDLAKQAAVWNNMGSVYRRTGRLQTALEYFNRSLEARRHLGDRRGEGRVLNNLGIASLRFGDPDRAEAHLRQALIARQESHDRRGEAVTRLNLGLVHGERGAWDEALASYRQALALQRQTSDRGSEATTLFEMGRAEAELGRSAAALEHFEMAIGILEELDNPWRQGLAKAALGQVLTVMGRPEKAMVPLEASLGLLRDAGDDIGIFEALIALGRAEWALAQRPSLDRETKRTHLTASFGRCMEALDLLEPLRADLDSLGLRTSLLSHHGDAFSFSIALAMDLHRLEPAADWHEQALAISERARARDFLDRLHETSVGIRRGVEASAQERQKVLLERLNAKVERRRRHLQRGKLASEVEHLNGEIQQLTQDLDGVEDEIRRQSPEWSALVHPHPLDATAIRGLLDAETTLLGFSLGTPKSFLWTVTSDEVKGYTLPDQATLEAAARTVHRAFKTYDPGSRSADHRAASRLSELLFAQVADELTTERLVIVADGALHYIPFAALPLPRSQEGVEAVPMLVRHEIVSLPSASVLGRQRAVLHKRPPAGQALAIIADPVFSPSDPRSHPAAAGIENVVDGAPATLRADGTPFERLAWSRWEAETIAAHAERQQTRLSLDFDANLQTIVDGSLRDHRIVHFATHGIIDTEHPELSALVLSTVDPEGRPRSGFLRLPEIYNLDLDADLVVLSGCRTALGAEVAGEGLVGIARGFFAAGARHLIASLWQVQDKATAELMDRFYRRLLGTPGETITPSAALRAAQLELIESTPFKDPYHWAAFAAYGDWRSPN